MGIEGLAICIWLAGSIIAATYAFIKGRGKRKKKRVAPQQPLDQEAIRRIVAGPLHATAEVSYVEPGSVAARFFNGELSLDELHNFYITGEIGAAEYHWILGDSDF